MAFDMLKERMAGADSITPMQIAHHRLFTAKEKIELLHQLKSDLGVANAEGRELGLAPQEIDAAIAEVHREVQDGVGPETVLRGDF